MLSGVSFTCFLFSYLVVLGMEASRSLFKLPGRNLLLVGMLVAGLLAHTIFLWNQFADSFAEAEQPQLMANWFQWTILSAWGLALASLVLTIRNPNGSICLFLIPVILALLGLAHLARGLEPFQPETTVTFWRTLHGVSLMLGTMFISFGFAFGLMYLLQSNRLKSKHRGLKRFRLPALEFLQSMNRLSLLSSSIALAVGLVSGVVLNFNRDGQIAWFSSGIVFSFALFALSLLATILESFSKRSLGGRRGAYLVIANFLFLAIVLTIVLVSSHGRSSTVSGEPTTELSSPLYHHQEVYC